MPNDLPDALAPVARRRLFWGACLPVRLSWAVAVLVWGRWYSVAPWMAVVCLSVSVSLFANVVRTALGLKTHGGFGGLVWWSRARVLHALLWLGAGVSLVVHQEDEYHLLGGGLLLADVVFAVLFGSLYYGWNIVV